MSRRSFIATGLACLMGVSRIARSQPTARTARIGLLNNANATVAAPSVEAFLQGLRDLGWTERRNVAIEYRWADGDMARHPALVAELVSMPVDVIVLAGTQALRAARQATTTIPIVVAIMPDPVALGFVASFARPGGNVTGLANLFEELTPKQLQIFHEMLPKAKRIALLSDRTMGDGIESSTVAAARALGLVVQVRQIETPSDFSAAFRLAKSEQADGVLVLPSPFFNRYRGRIAELAAEERLPTFSESREYVRDGGLLSYGPSFPQMYYRAATYVDRILKGEKPGDLPIERPTRFELVVNLRTAKALGIRIPEPILVRADEVIR